MMMNRAGFPVCFYQGDIGALSITFELLPLSESLEYGWNEQSPEDLKEC